MSEPPIESPPAATSTILKIVRWLPLVLLLALMIAAGIFWFGTETGRRWREQRVISRWAEVHSTIAPVAIGAIYVLAAVLALPVWWLQLMCGHLFGLIEGVAICQTAATLGATTAAAIARYSSAQLTSPTPTGRLAKLQSLKRSLGHNGLLVVMATRLLHGVPFGLSNYLFGAIGISVGSVALGTLIGNIPAVTVIVAAGRPHPMGGKLVWFIAALNVALLGIMAVRYFKPSWFRKIEVE